MASKPFFMGRTGPLVQKCHHTTCFLLIFDAAFDVLDTAFDLYGTAFDGFGANFDARRDGTYGR